MDIYDAMGIDPIVKDRIASTLVPFVAGTAQHVQHVNGLAFDPEIPLHLKLTLPSGAVWEKGEPNDQNYIKGSAKDWGARGHSPAQLDGHRA